jgi:hypothetical protein
MKTKKDRKICQIYITSFFSPFNAKIFLAEFVSQTSFIVVINDHLEAIKHGWFGTLNNGKDR